MLPTASVIDLCICSWPPTHEHFFQNRGRLEHLYESIIQYADRTSWEHGDREHEEIYGDEFNNFPKVDMYDQDFEYLRSVLIPYLMNT